MAGLSDLLDMRGYRGNVLRMPPRPDVSVMDGYQEPVPQAGYVNTEPPLEAPPISPDDLIGTGIPSKVAMGLKALIGPALLGGMMATGKGSVPRMMGQSGQIAYHGSPHKFDKFRSEAIGTGEGAQAYGHGLYLAEKEGVAQDYAKKLGIQRNGLSQQSTFRGESVSPIRTADFETVAPEEIIRHANEAYGLAGKSGDQKAQHVISISRRLFPNAPLSWEDKLDDLARATKDSDFGVAPPGNLYKTDIPDEVVARFLDWDKPLSQQAEVLAQLQKSKNKQIKAMLDFANKEYQSVPGEFPTAGEAFKLMSMNHTGRASADSAKASSLLAKQGIPGIRYLDGGSRSAGQGSSNFVAFDPEMIRILERNGVATGLQPWKPGEYRPLNDLMDVRKD